MIGKIIFMCSLAVAAAGICDTIYLNGTNPVTLFTPLTLSGISHCEIQIKAQEGHKIDAVLNANLPGKNIQIFDGNGFEDLLRTVVGEEKNICVSTTGNILRISYYTYRAKSKIHFDEGITGTYSQSPTYARVKEAVLEILNFTNDKSNCGKELVPARAEKNIAVFGSSGNSLDEVDCFWRTNRTRLRTNEMIHVVIKNLEINNANSYLEICQKLVKVKRIEKSITAPITLNGKEIAIRYRGGPKSSFVATYQIHTCDHTYQLKDNEEEKKITPSIFRLPDDEKHDFYSCEWTFKVSSNYYLVVEAKIDENTIHTTQYSSMNAYDNKTNAVWDIFGNPIYLSASGFLRVTFNNIVSNFPNIMFIIKRFKPSCGREMNATSLPQRFAPSSGSPSDCLWKIEGTLIRLNIYNLRLRTGDFLEVYEGPYLISRITNTMRRTKPLIARTSLGMNIRYHRTSSYGGFSAVYRKESCGRTYKLGYFTRKINFQFPAFLFYQPNYEYLRSYEINCNFNFIAKKGNIIDMRLQYRSTLAYANRIKILDNQTQLATFYQNDNIGKRNLISSGSKVALKMSFWFRFYKRSSNHFFSKNFPFSARVKQVKWSCGGELSASPSSSLFPPPGFRISPSSTDCFWVITASSAKRQIQLTIEELDFSDESSYLQVNNKLKDLGKLQKISKPLTLVSDTFRFYNPISVPKPRMVVKFHTGSNKASMVIRGSYKEVVCEKLLIPNKFGEEDYLRFPKDIDNFSYNDTCNYFFLSHPSDWLSIAILDLSPKNCCSEVQIFQSNQIVGSLKQGITMDTFLLTGSQVRLHYATNSSRSPPKQYYLNYRIFKSNCGARLDASDTDQIITSPRYPNFYGINHQCVWTITASNRKRIRFTLDVLDVGKDYLEIKDGNKPTEKFRGSIDSPVTFVSTGSKIRVYFHSRFHLRKKGFKATFAED